MSPSRHGPGDLHKTIVVGVVYRHVYWPDLFRRILDDSTVIIPTFDVQTHKIRHDRSLQLGMRVVVGPFERVFGIVNTVRINVDAVFFCDCPAATEKANEELLMVGADVDGA